MSLPHDTSLVLNDLSVSQPFSCCKTDDKSVRAIRRIRTGHNARLDQQYLPFCLTTFSRIILPAVQTPTYIQVGLHICEQASMKRLWRFHSPNADRSHLIHGLVPQTASARWVLNRHSVSGLCTFRLSSCFAFGLSTTLRAKDNQSRFG